MIDKNIYELSHKYSSLSDSDIEELIKEARKIEETNKYQDEDVFIDILSDVTDDAVVVYHRSPRESNSIYKENVVGKIAKRLNEPGVYRTFETALITEGLLAKTQENKWIRQKVFPLRNNQKTIGVLIVEFPVKEIRSEGLKEASPSPSNTKIIDTTSMFYSTIMDNLDEAILIFDANGYLIMNNDVANSYYFHFGYIEKIIGLHYDNLSLDTTTFEQLIYLKDTEKWLNVKQKEIVFGSSHFQMKRFFDAKTGLFTMILHDKTEIYNREVEIVEKSVAIKEIHHRVKNNLQSIVSLLRIQARRSSNQEVVKLLRESENRILAISATHELLSKKIDNDVSLIEVLDLTISNCNRAFLDNKKVKIEKNIDADIRMDSDKTVTVALIVNELLQNSFEHGFLIEEHENKIKVDVEKLEDNMVSVVIKDNGSGYNAEKSYNDSLGLKIVTSYVKDKLRGKLKIISSRTGTSTYFCFKI